MWDGRRSPAIGWNHVAFGYTLLAILTVLEMPQSRRLSLGASAVRRKARKARTPVVLLLEHFKSYQNDYGVL